MTKAQLSQLLEKYLNGNCTAEEVAVIDQWYEKYADEPDFLEGLPAVQRDFIRQKMFANILSEAAINTSTDKPTVTAPARFHQQLWFKTVAAALVLIIGSFSLYSVFSTKKTHTPGYTRLWNNSAVIVKKTLSDGSTVWLKPDAILTFPGKFTSSTRNVTMKGECFFEITKDPSHPFIITSSHMVTKVWGTSFQVIDFENAREAFVTVVTGKVSVKKRSNEETAHSKKESSDELMVYPDQQVSYAEHADQLLATANANIKQVALWKHLNVSFDNEKLSAIIKKLSSNFQVQIRVADPGLGDKQMTGDFGDLNLPEVLEVMKASMKIDYKITGDQIALYQTNK